MAPFSIYLNLFGFTTTNINCQNNPSVTSFIHDLFISANNDEEDFSISSTNRQVVTFGRNSIYNNEIIKKQPSTSQYQNSSPINPLDFTVRPSKSFSYITKQHQQQKEPINENQRKYSIATTNGNNISASGTNRLAQALIIQHLNNANDLIQAALLELIINKEIRLNTTRYTTPRPHFLTIAIIPESPYHNTISSLLLDHFFLSYRFKEEFFQHSSSIPSLSNLLPNDIRSKSQSRRMALFQNEEIKSLADYASKVHINIDITRYIRDIVVGIRTHNLVQGGLTARTSQDIINVTRSLAAVFNKKFLTPDLVAVAIEKVVGHRLRINTNSQSKDNSNNVIADIVSDILRIVYAPV
ncbi:unnamed protein product [Cunninghamella echinulata]